MLDILDINASVLHDFLSNVRDIIQIMSSTLFDHYVAVCNSNTPDKKFKKLVRVMSAILTTERIPFGSAKMDKYLDKWTCRRTSSFQHVTYPADKW